MYPTVQACSPGTDILSQKRTDNDSNYFRSRRVGYNTYMRFGRNGAQTVNRPNPSLIFSQQEHVPFLRFRRQGLDPLIRKGRQPSFPFLRFGRQGPFPIIRFGRQEPDLGSKFLEPRSNLFLRNEKTFPYMRFGKRNFPYLRFGRSYPLNRAEVPELYLGYEDPLDESLGPDFDLDVLRSALNYGHDADHFSRQRRSLKLQTENGNAPNVVRRIQPNTDGYVSADSNDIGKDGVREIRGNYYMRFGRKNVAEENDSKGSDSSKELATVSDDQHTQ